MAAASSSVLPPSGAQGVVAGRYELIKRLGRGGMGEVFSAHDRSTRQPVALKRLLDGALSQRGASVHFRREYHALAELSHPRIIQVYDYGYDGQIPYYTMELLDGQDLRDVAPLPYREACSYLRDVASSLALLHARRLLHRDVSPRNVRRTSDGHCKLLDFGAMVAFGLPPNVTGTPPCVAPEALNGAALDQRADLYSLGALAYWLLTGRHGRAVTHLDELPRAWSQPLRRPKRISAEIPTELDELVMSLMHVDPMKRPKSAAEVIDWLSAIGELPEDESAGAARSFFTGTQLCGRGAHRDELTRHIERAARGHGGVVVVEGKPGAGKSRLLAEARLIAQTSGVTVVHGQARGVNRTLAEDLVLALRQVVPLEAEAAGARRIVWPRMHGSQLAHGTVHDPAEMRGQLQQALVSVFRDVSRARPLLVSIDDFDRADDVSLGLVVGLAHEARNLPLLIVASRTVNDDRQANQSEVGRLDLVRGVTGRLRLRELSHEQSLELVSSVFGSVPNLDRLHDWLFRVARGNPKLTLELAEQLYARGVVRYVEGTWIVSGDEITLNVPADFSAAWGLRLRDLSPTALALAELLSLRRGGVGAELCASLASGQADGLVPGLDELVRAGVLESAGAEGYVIAEDSARRALAERLSPERLRELHRRWADILANEAKSNPDAALEAGWHLIHTEDELRGAELLAKVAPEYVDQGLALGTAIPALEKALEVYERHRCPLAVRLRIRSALLLAGYLFDYRLAFRYGEQTVTMLHEASGVALAARLRPKLGALLALLVALVVTFFKRFITPKEHRGPPVIEAVRYFIRGTMGLIGVRATSLDAKAVTALADLLAPFGALPRGNGAQLAYLATRPLVLQMLGRDAEYAEAIQRALAELQRGNSFGMSAVEHRWLLVGMLTAYGVHESYREGSRALEHADALDALGTRLAHGGALRIRTIYYARRGDSDRAAHYRRLSDLHALQGGTAWQGEWFSVPLEGLAGATWTDLVAMRQALERLDRLAEDVPSMAGMRDALRIPYHFRRGEYALAAAQGEKYLAAHPPRTIVGWSAAYAITALSWIELGQVERALELCSDALAHVSKEDLRFFVLYAPLEVAYATALALSGEKERAKELMRVRIERLREHGEHASLVNLYQYQARMMWLIGDRAGLAASLQAMRTAALSSGLRSVILLADRVAELRSAMRSSAPPSSEAKETDEVEVDQGTENQRRGSVTAVTAFLNRARTGRERCVDALWFLTHYAAAKEAFLYRLRNGELEIVACVPEEAEPPQLEEAVLGGLRRSERPSMFSVVPPHPANDDGERRFRVVPLTAADEGRGERLGVVALLEGPELLPALPEDVLADVAHAVAEDVSVTIVERGKAR